MNIQIRPAGYVFIGLAVAALLFRLFYTLFVGDHIDYADLMERLHIGYAANAPQTTTSAPAAPPPPAAKTLNDWLLLAPIPTGITEKASEVTLGKMLDTAFLSGEGNLQPHDGDIADINGTKRTWIAAKYDKIDWNKVSQNVEKKPESTTYDACVGYAVTTVDVPKDVSNATLYLGSDDGIEVWLNGKAIHRNTVIRGCNLGDDKVPNLTLHAGKNTFVFKIANGDGGWESAAALAIP